MYAVAAAVAGVRQFIDWDAGLKWTILERAVTLLLGKEIATIGDDKTHIAGAGLIDPRKIDLIENAVAHRKPDLAVLVQGCANAGFRARSPAWRDAGPSGGIARRRISHKGFRPGWFSGSFWYIPLGIYKTLTRMGSESVSK